MAGIPARLARDKNLWCSKFMLVKKPPNPFSVNEKIIG
jgi:hypothetical protein